MFSSSQYSYTLNRLALSLWALRLFLFSSKRCHSEAPNTEYILQRVYGTTMAFTEVLISVGGNSNTHLYRSYLYLYKCQRVKALDRMCLRHWEQDNRISENGPEYRLQCCITEEKAQYGGKRKPMLPPPMRKKYILSTWKTWKRYS